MRIRPETLRRVNSDLEIDHGCALRTYVHLQCRFIESSVCIFWCIWANRSRIIKTFWTVVFRYGIENHWYIFFFCVSRVCRSALSSSLSTGNRMQRTRLWEIDEKVVDAPYRREDAFPFRNAGHQWLYMLYSTDSERRKRLLHEIGLS